MSFKNIGGGSSLEGIVNDINQNIFELKNREVTQIFKDDTGTRRILLGKGTDNFYGMKVSQPSFDVYTAEDDELIFNSDQNNLKVALSGEASGLVSSLTENATATTTVAHNLGFVPAAIVYVNGTGSTYLTSGRYYVTPTAVSIKVGANYHPGIIFEYQLDATNLYLTVTNRSTASPITDVGTVNWKYYLLQETAG
jgi:hypothetical protein